MRHLVRLVLAITVMVVAATSPARADSKIGLSPDGVVWAPTLPEPLFDPAVRWVPGDSRTASFYVRNQAGDGSELSIDVLGAQVDSLVRTGDLVISARGGGGLWQDVSVPGRHRLVSAVAIASGDHTRVDVSVAFRSAARNQSQVKQLQLDFQVVLREAVGGGSADHGLLPVTGAPALWSVVIGLALVAGGTILVPRRREEEGVHVHP